MTASLKAFCASAAILTGEVVTPTSVETNEGEADRLQSVVDSSTAPLQEINVQAIARSNRTRFRPVAWSNASPENNFRLCRCELIMRLPERAKHAGAHKRSANYSSKLLIGIAFGFWLPLNEGERISGLFQVGKTIQVETIDCIVSISLAGLTARA
jgi:hypothetical protein